MNAVGLLGTIGLLHSVRTLGAKTLNAKTLNARTLNAMTLNAMTLRAMTLGANNLSADALTAETLNAKSLSAIGTATAHTVGLGHLSRVTIPATRVAVAEGLATTESSQVLEAIAAELAWCRVASAVAVLNPTVFLLSLLVALLDRLLNLIQLSLQILWLSLQLMVWHGSLSVAAGLRLV